MTPQIDFMSIRTPASLLSLLLVLLSIFSLSTRQLSLGLDFTGGTLVEIELAEPFPLMELREALSSNFAGSVVQYFGSETDVLVRIPPSSDTDAHALGQQAFEAMEAAKPGIRLKRVEFVGPQVGDELRDQSGVAMLVALGFMLAYITIRFTNKFAIGAVAALFHDVLIVLGMFSFFRLEFDLTVLAAVLAVIGYSLNDTIVIADRIRENFRTVRDSSPIEIINLSINQTLTRTLFTALTTMLVLVALFYFGGELIHNFATALLVGIFVGTYSSVYIASNLLLLMNIQREDFVVVKVEEIDDMP